MEACHLASSGTAREAHQQAVGVPISGSTTEVHQMSMGFFHVAIFYLVSGVD
jgi:hypothetical protein